MNIAEGEMLRYTGCGLDNIYLQDGFAIDELRGESVIRIEDLEGLHRAIAMAIADSTAPLDAKTFRFLRKEQDMSQRQLAAILGVDEQTVSLWERARLVIPQAADLVLRTLTKERCSGNAELIRMIERLNTLDRDLRRWESRMEFTQRDGHWDRSKAA